MDTIARVRAFMDFKTRVVSTRVATVWLRAASSEFSCDTDLIVPLELTAIKDDALRKIITTGRITTLYVRECVNLTGECIRAVSARCTSLLSLNVEGCAVTDEDMAVIAENCPSLTSLDVKKCSELTDASIISIAERCPLLTNLDISRCYNLTDASIGSVASGCASMTSLQASDCYKLGDASIEALVSRCPLLRSLCFSRCNLTNASVEAVAARRCPLLSRFIVLSCRNIDDASIASLQLQYPSMRISKNLPRRQSLK